MSRKACVQTTLRSDHPLDGVPHHDRSLHRPGALQLLQAVILLFQEPTEGSTLAQTVGEYEPLDFMSLVALALLTHLMLHPVQVTRYRRHELVSQQWSPSDAMSCGSGCAQHL